jgi:hypothetical protein
MFGKGPISSSQERNFTLALVCRRHFFHILAESDNKKQLKGGLLQAYLHAIYFWAIFCACYNLYLLMEILIIPLLVFPVLVAARFFIHLGTDRPIHHSLLMRVAEIWTVVIAPWIFLSVFDLSEKNDCCSGSAVFSPEHRVGIYTTIILCVAAYFYSSFRQRPASPVIELLTNAALVLGVVLNVLLIIQVGLSEVLLWLPGNLPILLLFLLQMKKNQQLLVREAAQHFATPGNRFRAWCIRILQTNAWTRFPLLAMLALPILLLVTAVLTVFGQKPDTLVRAFTDTYKHGFSQLDHLCLNVQCGGHFLCSVAAKGHKSIVKPERYGERNGHLILCNRQLLVANAFEELLQDHLPFVHRQVRRQYNKVGKVVHRYYAVFDHKFVADTVYVLMKPLEWTFLLTLYTFDTRPEDRIAQQYLRAADRTKIQALTSACERKQA